MRNFLKKALLEFLLLSFGVEVDDSDSGLNGVWVALMIPSNGVLVQ